MSTPIPAAVLGATGYVSGELLRLLAGHPGFELVAAVSDGHAGKSVGAIFPHLANTYDLQFASHDNWIDSIDNNSDLALFSAAPHGASAAIIAGALQKAAAKKVNVHVVDASADFRYSSQKHYEAVYGIKHGAPELIPSFQCGVPEQLEKLTAAHVGHPGCFATAVLLAIVPLLGNKLIDGELFVTGVTGSTGSGRQAQAGTHHPERHSNMYAYKALEHRHAPEIVTL
ncbi:MAG: N-acetyl-gamma-glutamyl-phosphate reductase, partial [Woeseiaceae bacterium]|nr:N-acetyl-gamma-glutamyl-phosphate reductase [Woeseiaceae bacterium]